MEIVEDSSIIESVSLLSSSDDEIIEYISKENIGLKLSELQQEILSMCDNHHTFFAIDNNWYRGVMAHFDFNEIVKDILEVPTRKKKITVKRLFNIIKHETITIIWYTQHMLMANKNEHTFQHHRTIFVQRA